MSSRYPPPDPRYDDEEPEDDDIRISRRTALAGAAGVVATAAAAVLFILLRGDGEDDGDSDDNAAAASATPEPSAIPSLAPPTDTPAPPAPTDTPAEVATATPEAPPTAEITSTEESTPTESAPTETPAPPTPTATQPPPTATPVPPPAPGWTLLEPAGDPPAARRDHSLVADQTGERVYLFGGRAGSEVFQDLWVYDVPGNSWIQVEPGGEPPPARFGHNAIYDTQQRFVVIFGGQAGSTFFNDVWIYDPVDNIWAMLEAGDEDGTPLARYGAASAARDGGGALFISHGFTTDGRFDDTWLYDLQGGQWSDVSPADGPRPQARCLMRMAADPERERLLMFGGQSNTAAYLGDLWAFDTVSHGWQELETDNPPPRNLYSLVRRDDAGDLILFGGASASGPLGDAWAFSVEDEAWEPIFLEGGAVGIVPPRDSHDAAWLNGQVAMLVFGGRGLDGALNDLWIFVPTR